MIKVLMADDHAILRAGLKQLFALTDDIVVAAEAINGDQVLEQVERGGFDLLLLDMSMPGISGVDLIACIHDLPILVLTMHGEPQIASKALRSGASGYITKDCDPEYLLAAVRKVASGGRYIFPALADQIAFA